MFSPLCPSATLFEAWMSQCHRDQEIAEGLVYRDFITVGLLVDKLAVSGAGRVSVERYLDLHSGAGCAGWPAADLQ